MCTSTFSLRGLSSAAIHNLLANGISYLNYLNYTVIQLYYPQYHLAVPLRV